MSAVGAYLRDLRERQGISLEELSRSTRVLHHYLEALESDDLASLPAPVFAKGFIRAYCQALGVSADEAIALYDQRAGHVRERVTVAPAPPPPPPPSLLPPPTPVHQAQVAAAERRGSRGRGAVLISFVLLVVMGAALFAVTMALQSGHDEGDGTAATQVAAIPAPEPAQPPVPEPPAAPPSVSPTVSAAAVSPPTPASVAPAPVSASGPIVSPYRLV